jgi:hypothetical protein
VIEPLPHVGVLVDPTNAARSLWHVNSVEVTEGDGNSVVNDVLVVEELSRQVPYTEEGQRVEEFQVQIADDAVNVEEVQTQLGQEEPEGKPKKVQDEALVSLSRWEKLKLLFRHVRVAAEDHMWTGEECREVEDVAEAVDDAVLEVISVGCIGSLKVEADILEQTPGKYHEKVMDPLIAYVENFGDDLVIRFQLEVIEYCEPTTSEHPHDGLSAGARTYDVTYQGLQVHHEQELNVVHKET